VRTKNRFAAGWLVAAGALLCSGLIGCNAGGGGGAAGGGAGGAGTFTLDSGDPTNVDKERIQIGLVASLNGELRPWGKDSENGARLAVTEFNQAGGLDGRMVQLLIEDSGSKPEQGRTAAERLISKGAIAVIGEVASGITAQVALAATARNVPVVAVGATRDDITELGDNIFRVCYTDSLQGPVMAQFAYDDLGLRRIAIVTDRKQPYSTGLSNSFRQHFQKLGGQVVTEEFYESGQTQFGGQLTNLRARNPDGLFLSGYFNEVGPLVRQARDAGIQAKVLGGDGWDSSEILVSGGEAILGGYFCNHYNNQEDRAEVKTFLDLWGQAPFEQKVPGTTMGALGYDATALVLDALKRASDTTPAAIAEAIANTEGFQGVSGEITLRGMNGNPPKRALVVQLTEEGQVPVRSFAPEDLTASRGQHKSLLAILRSR
jgi:branched-chain amino acid transport system substrate-binding protein